MAASVSVPAPEAINNGSGTESSSRLKLPAPMFKLGVLRSRGVVVAPPQVRIAAPSAA